MSERITALDLLKSIDIKAASEIGIRYVFDRAITDIESLEAENKRLKFDVASLMSPTIMNKT